MARYIVRRTIDESQVVDAANAQEAAEIAMARPDAWQHSDEEYDVELEQALPPGGGDGLKRRVTFFPQAWVRDQAIEVDAEGETTFYVANDHLKRHTPDALKYELEPYQDLPNLPEWIREWRGPFWFDVEDEPELIELDRESASAYRYEDWSIQCPHALDANDPDRNWYATTDDGEALGPFDTLHEARVYLTRYASIDDWRGDLCGYLRDLGRDELADEIGGISDQEAMVYRDTDDDPIAIARMLHEKHPPQQQAA